MLSLLALCTFSVPTDARIRLVRDVVQDLQVELGRNIRIEPRLADLPIFVDRQDSSPQKTLTAIARGLRASVVNTGNGWRVEQTDEDKKASLTSAQLVWKRRIDEWLTSTETLVKQSQNAESLDVQRSRYETRARQVQQSIASSRTLTPGALSTVDYTILTPEGLFYREVVASLGSERLTKTKPETFRIWSSRLGPGLLPISDGELLFEAYRQRARRSVDAAKLAAADRYTFKQFGGDNMVLRIYDSQGNQLAMFAGPPYSQPMAGPIAIDSRLLAGIASTTEDRWIPLGTEKGQLDPAMEQRDPLDNSVGIGLSEITRRANKATVIIPTDDLLELANACIKERKFNGSAFDKAVKITGAFEWVEQGGVGIMRPIDPYTWIRRTVPRDKLAAALDVAKKNPNLGHQIYARAFAKAFPAEDSPLLRILLQKASETRPGAYRVFNESAGSLALIGTAMEDSGLKEGRSLINASLEPYRTLIARGMNDGWLRFHSTVRVPSSDLDPSALYTTFGSRLGLAIDRVSEERIAMIDRQRKDIPGDPSLQTVESLGQQVGRDGLANPLVAAVPFNEEAALKTYREFGRYARAAEQRWVVSVVPKEGIWAEVALREKVVFGAYGAFEALPSELGQRLIQSALRARRQVNGGENAPPPS